MAYFIRCNPRFDLGNRRGLSRMINVVDEFGGSVGLFEIMCDAIDSDIQNPQGSGATALEEISRIEKGEAFIETSGNAWVTHITLKKVWFEGLYSQGEGGEVSFEQYKVAVHTYVRFLADADYKPIEVEFPEQ